MKKIIYLLLIIPFIFSCSNDNEERDEISKSDLLGSWEYINKDGTSGSFLEFDNDKGTYIVFRNAKNTFSDWFTYSLTGTTITLNYNANGTKTYNIYKVGNNKIEFDNQILTKK